MTTGQFPSTFSAPLAANSALAVPGGVPGGERRGFRDVKLVSGDLLTLVSDDMAKPARSPSRGGGSFITLITMPASSGRYWRRRRWLRASRASRPSTNHAGAVRSRGGARLKRCTPREEFLLLPRRRRRSIRGAGRQASGDTAFSSGGETSQISRMPKWKRFPSARSIAARNADLARWARGRRSHSGCARARFSARASEKSHAGSAMRYAVRARI